MCKVVSCCELAISHFIRKGRKTMIRAKALLCIRHTMHSSIEASIENARASSLTWSWRSFLVKFLCILVSQFCQVVVIAQMVNWGTARTYCLGLLILPKRKYLVFYCRWLLLLLRRCHLMVVLHFLNQKVFDPSAILTVQITARHFYHNWFKF